MSNEFKTKKGVDAYESMKVLEDAKQIIKKYMDLKALQIKEGLYTRIGQNKFTALLLTSDSKTVQEGLDVAALDTMLISMYLTKFPEHKSMDAKVIREKAVDYGIEILMKLKSKH